jgi:hypothetical protein
MAGMKDWFRYLLVAVMLGRAAYLLTQMWLNDASIREMGKAASGYGILILVFTSWIVFDRPAKSPPKDEAGFADPTH